MTLAVYHWLRCELQEMIAAGCDAAHPAALEREIVAVMQCANHEKPLREAARHEDPATRQDTTAVEAVVLHALCRKPATFDRTMQAVAAAHLFAKRLGGHSDAALKIFALAALARHSDPCRGWNATVDALLDAAGAGAPAYGACMLEELVGKSATSSALGKLAPAVLPVVLPRFFEHLQHEAERVCLRHMQWHIHHKAVYRAVAVVRPGMLVLTGDAAHDRLVTGLNTAHRRRALRHADPRVYGSALLSEHSGLRPQHSCIEERCLWWSVACDWLVNAKRLHTRSMDAMAQHLLVEDLCCSGRFNELVRLCVAGVIGMDTITSVWPPFGASALYTADDIALALVGLDDCVAAVSASCCGAVGTGAPQPAHRAAAMDTFVAHLKYVSGCYWTLFRPLPLPRWTVETHRALYCHNKAVHDTTRALFMLHELRRGSEVARLPYELLFVLVDWVSVATLSWWRRMRSLRLSASRDGDVLEEQEE